MASPPKPWQRLSVPSSTTTPTSATAPAAVPTTASSTTLPPSVPERPEPLASTSVPSAIATSSAYSPYSTSPYSRLGTGYGAMGYGGYGMNSMYGTGYGYNSMYGSGMYGGGMYGGGMYGGMGMGMPGMPNGQPSLSQQLESTTQQTFALLQSIVQTFSGVAQMLESTFMATHSSFFAMVGVIEQFGQLRNALGSVLGLFGLVRWAQDVVRGRTGLRGEFQDFVNGKPIGPSSLSPSSSSSSPAPKPSKKPLIVFLLAVIGVPYAFTKLIRLLAARQQEQLALQQQQSGLGPLDASQLTFARALYQFTPNSSKELALNENEIVAIVAKFDPRTNQEVDPRTDLSETGGGEWWKGRTRDGREGWFPKKWVEIIERKKPMPVS